MRGFLNVLNGIGGALALLPLLAWGTGCSEGTDLRENPPSGEPVVTSAAALAEDTSGNLFTAGVLSGATVLRKSTDGGANWARVSDSDALARSLTQLNALGTAQGGNLLALGYGPYQGTSQNHWLVLLSSDQGATWAAADALAPSGTQEFSEASAMARDPSGDLYVVGKRIDSSLRSHWIVRKGNASATSWATVDDFQHSIGNAFAVSVAISAAGTVYIAGGATETSGGTRWLVRKSSDSGTTWTTVDDYVFPGGDSTSARGLVVDATGAVFVAGGYFLERSRWLVRKSSDAGATWTNVDDYQHPGPAEALARGINRDGAGNLYAFGYGSRSWLVRKSTDAGATWSTVDQFELSPNVFNDPRAAFSSSDGKLLVAGGAGASWIVRGTSNAGTTWTTLDESK